MPFIQMAHFRLNAERLKQSPAADSQHDLLLQPQLRTAPIKLAGDAPVSREVREIIAVQEVKLDSANMDLPCSKPDRVSGQVKF